MKVYKLISLVILFILMQTTETKQVEDVFEFIQLDQTNTLAYSTEFDCKDFSETLKQNAIKNGFESKTVWVVMRSDGIVGFHVFVMFEFENNVIWIEPQNDRQYIVSSDSLCYIDGECVADEILYIRYD